MIGTEPPRLLKYGEVARRLNVSPSTARRYGAAGLIDVVRLTRQTHRVRPQSVERFIDLRSAGRHAPGDVLTPP
jgi:predicted site-specific integrase-resolvase